MPDNRRAISRPVWLANRARNALRRPAFIGAISVGTFVTCLVSMVVVPRAQRQAARELPTVARPDTLSIAATAALGRSQLAEAESALAVARTDAATASTIPPDTTVRVNVAARDSIIARIARLESQIARADQAPLTSSYHALAELPELRSDARVRALVDSLTDVEREREGFGTVGGVDPIFVALTSRLNEIGRAIQAIAGERRNALLAELTPTGGETPAVAARPTVDTTARVAQRDSLRSAIRRSEQELTRRRETSRALDLAEERARERANAVAPPLALLGSAFVLSAVIGFAVAFLGELRRPRASDANELERYLGVRVLSTVETPMPSVDRGRREADRAAPPYFDPGAEGYQLAFLGVATDHPTLLMATITGDDPVIAAVVACNLAAIAADEARNTLVVDLEPSCKASAALRTRISPGLLDILRGDATWPDATVAASVGRNKTVDLVPFGVGTPPPPEQLFALLGRDALRLARYYDAILLVAAANDVAAGLPKALLSPEVIYTAQPGITPLRELRAQLESIRAGGGSIRGIVLWNAERPLLPAPRELASRPKRQQRKEEPVAVATS
ncbi:MAG: hypothetical protein WD825_15710 [Gemmatimonadaceae bacterium]